VVAESSIKQKVLEAVQQLPADATVEDALERLYFLAKVERGLADAHDGRVVSHEEVRKRFALAVASQLQVRMSKRWQRINSWWRVAVGEESLESRMAA
jgi:predicted transcriptional regulator